MLAGFRLKSEAFKHTTAGTYAAATGCKYLRGDSREGGVSQFIFPRHEYAKFDQKQKSQINLPAHKNDGQ